MKIEIATIEQICARHKLLGKQLIMFHLLGMVYWIAALSIEEWWAYAFAGLVSALTLANTVMHACSGKRIARLVKREKELNVYLNELYDRIKPV